MNYPFWDAGVSYGVMMAVIAILHVFVSHFAIGGGLYLVVTERAARRAQDGGRLEFLRRLSKFFILVTLVTGALTGVWIWFVIGLQNPAATEALIHNFVWGWATEWTLFAVEIAAAILYYYGWKRMSARSHLIVGWIYFVAAWLSLAVINGILTFMLTPGEWPRTGDFWDGFFNPTYWPTLVLRTGVSLMLAGLYALLVASRYEGGPFKASLVRYTAAWGIAGLAVAVASMSWYWKSIPSEITAAALQVMPTPIGSWNRSYWVAAALAALLLLFGLAIPRRLDITAASLLMVLGLGWFSTFEWFRESVRKPYVIHGYMYGNGIEVARADEYRKDGYLSKIAYRTGDEGADLYRRACRTCHTFSGYQALKPAFDGTDRAFIKAMVSGVHLIRGNMPPFLGTDAEADAIAGCIHSRTDRRPFGEIHGFQGVELGKKVYEVRCARCHIPGTPRDKTSSLAGLTEQDYSNMLEMASALGEGMPDFTGDAGERAALVEYLKTMTAGGRK